MTAPTNSIPRRRSTQRATFERILVGVDNSEPGFEACRQAAALAAPDATLEAFTVVNLAEAVHTGFAASRVAEQLQSEAEDALERAGAILGEQAHLRLVNGVPEEALMHELARFEPTALAIGTHGHRRSTEILIGGVAGEMLHRAPCSVLVARPPAEAAAFPHAIVVGIDGSPESDLALATGPHLARRFEVPLRTLAALRGKDVDLVRVRLRAPLADKIDEHPVTALVDASQEADLVIVGSRGLHGLRALGSVSERVAHQAACSVLVVRAPPEA